MTTGCGELAEHQVLLLTIVKLANLRGANGGKEIRMQFKQRRRTAHERPPTLDELSAGEMHKQIT